MIFEEKEKVDFENSNICWICQKGFNEIYNDKVRDQCHFTGKYKDATHNKCNLQYKKPRLIPVVFHNLSGYSAHLFRMNHGVSEGNINCIPNNEGKYINTSKEISR